MHSICESIFKIIFYQCRNLRNIDRTIHRVIIDDQVTFNQHRATRASKIARNAGVIYKVKCIVPLQVVKTLYNSLIQSHPVYCSNLWVLWLKISVARIFSTEKRTIRGFLQGLVNYIYKKYSGELPAHTKNIFAENEFLIIHNLLAQQAVAFMQKSLHTLYRNLLSIISS